MKKQLRKAAFTFGFLLLSFCSFSQIDIQVEMPAPGNGQTLYGGHAFVVSFTLRNKSTTAVPVSNMIIRLRCFLDSDTIQDLSGDHIQLPLAEDLKAGGSITIPVNFTANFSKSKENVQFCQTIYLENNGDPDLTNNIACATVNVQANATGLETTKQEGIQVLVYPNPVSSMLTFSSEIEMNGQLLITDLLGRIMISQPIEGRDNKLNVSGLPNGFYTYRMVSSEELTLKAGKIQIDH